jgi:anion-transporting  ArsA/GET3 family ATPase
MPVMQGNQDLTTALRECRLLVTAGSGGVGKTTLAAALAIRAAEFGRRVAVLTIDPARRLAQALGIAEFSDELHHIDLGPNCPGELWAMMLDTQKTGDAMVRRFAKDANAAEAILNNRYYGYFSTSLAGSLEYMAIEQVRLLIEESGFDLIVLDTPPATHALDFIDAPERLIDGLERIPLKLIGAQGGRGIAGRLANQGRNIVLRGLNRLTGGPFLKDLADFLSQFHGILDALKTAGQHVQLLLRDSRTRFILVTTPTIGRVDEVIAFRSDLRRRKLPLGGFLVNRIHTLLPDPMEEAGAITQLRDACAETPLNSMEPKEIDSMLNGLRQTLLEHNRLALRDADVCRRLSEAAQSPPIIAPHLAGGVTDIDALRAIADYIAPLKEGT